MVVKEVNMSRYKVEICNVNTQDLTVLSPAEMKEAFIAYQAGDESIKEVLLRGNLKLVLSMVQRFSSRCENMDDLFQVGCIGLVKSIENFDLSHDVRFSTYAVPMILGEIKRYLRDNQMIRVSRNCKDLAHQCFKLKEEYYHEYACECSVEYLCEQTQAKRRDVIEALDSFQSVLSIHEPISNAEGDEMCLVDTISDSKDEIALLGNLLTLRKSLKQLSPKELDILNKRYYLDYTQSEIAKEMGISQAQVSRLEKGALKCLKKNFE